MLAQQLEAHRSRTGNATSATQTKWRPSVLMDPREAADLDIATVRDVAANGFAELVMLAPALSDFEGPLFGSSLSASTERHMLDPAAADALQNALNRFLAMVSPFLQHRCSLKVIDFLLRRHHVHVHNADALMLAILPYHETELFVKVSYSAVAQEAHSLPSECHKWRMRLIIITELLPQA
jgi:U3 small nucleolar RNA-associated protein 10